jgi:uncharacterized protein
LEQYPAKWGTDLFQATDGRSNRMASSPQHEPTMEEILASIRKIISEDSSEAHAATAIEEKPAPARAPAAPPSPVADADVLELTQEVPEEPPSRGPEPPPPDNDIVFRTIEEPAPAPEPEPGPEPEPEAGLAPAPEPAAAQVYNSEGIFSDHHRQALGDALDSIEQSLPEDKPEVVQTTAPLPAGGEQAIGAVILEAVRAKVDPAVKQWLSDNSGALVDHMKPFVREWLDENFTAILEGAVRNEVDRVLRARGTKR